MRTEKPKIKSNHENIYESVGDALRSLRRSRKYNQAAVASALGISASAYSHYECSDRLPDLAQLVKLSNLYGININYLLLICCIDVAKMNNVSLADVFEAYTHEQIVPEEQALILSRYNRLSKSEKATLTLFLDAMSDCSITETR